MIKGAYISTLLTPILWWFGSFCAALPDQYKHNDNFQASVRCDSTVLSRILALPLQYYIGKPVDSLFAALPTNYTDRNFIPVGVGYARGVTQGYGTEECNSCFVQIFIDSFHFMTFPNRTVTTNWNMNLARKETISFIKVWENNICRFGCNNPKYD